MDLPECPGCRERDARIAAHEARILALEAQVRDLLDKLKPPTSRVVTPQPPAPAKTPTGKKPGAQPGHPPLMKELVPPQRVNEVVPYIPERCAKCDKPLPAKMGTNDPEPKRHQVAELPPVMVHCTAPLELGAKSGLESGGRFDQQHPWKTEDGPPAPSFGFPSWG